MSCPSETYSGDEFDNQLFTNWAGCFSGPVNTLFQPNSLADLVNRIELAASKGHTVHVMGSGWAFENSAYSRDWMLRLSNMNKVLTDVTSSALNADWTARQKAGPDFLVEV